jgi:2-keto-3-deoxy-6-phosphogluconate aldolase
MRNIPKKPKGKSLIKKTSGLDTATDFIMTVGPHAQDIANYTAHGAAAIGVGALARIRKKLKQIDKKYGGSQK